MYDALYGSLGGWVIGKQLIRDLCMMPYMALWKLGERQTVNQRPVYGTLYGSVGG